MGGLNPEVGQYPRWGLQEGVVTLIGSFQGNGASNPTAAQQRGFWFTVTHAGTGQYRVALSFTVPTALVAGQPAGLLMEPVAWIVSETVATQPVKVWITQTTKYDTTTHAQTFDIFCLDNGNSNTATDVTTADRVFFEIAWKGTSFAP